MPGVARSDIVTRIALACWVLAAAITVAQSTRSETESALRERALHEPQSFEANHQMAEFYASKDMLPQAIIWFEKARRIDPAHHVNGYDLALAYTRADRLDKARAQIGAMLARQDRADLHNLLGLVEEKAGHIQLAADQYQQAAHMDPTEKHVFDLGQCFLKYHGISEAVQIFTWGAEKYPESARMRVAQGVALYSVGSYDKAVEALCNGVDLDPTDQRALYFLGQMYDISPQMAEEVTKRLAHFVQVYPNNASANYYYALSLWKRMSGKTGPGADPGIERYLKRAVALDNKLAAAYFQLGVLYSDQRKDDEALREFERAVKFDPENDKYRYRLAQAYRFAGLEDKASEQLRQYRKLHHNP